MAMNTGDYPYKTLGARLKHMREKQLESVAEACGAVEIETSMLSAIESGKERPSEDILDLLISHFGVKEDEASKLWELAGFEVDDTPISQMINDDLGMPKSAVMVMPMDARIVYTDMVHVMVNNFGVVMNFMQGSGPNNQALAVARIGMSKEHARSVLEVLKQTLEHAETAHVPKALSQSQDQPNTLDSK